MMQRSKMKADTLYYIRSSQQFLYTPDGVGGYWYDTALEVMDAGFGDLPVNYIDVLTD